MRTALVHRLKSCFQLVHSVLHVSIQVKGLTNADRLAGMT